MKNWEANCKTTAMGIMPHTDIDKALDLVLSLDIPFWPQLPRINYYEDMYAQISEGFPGISIDVENERVLFDTNQFIDELGQYADRADKPETFMLSSEYSVVFHQFLEKDLDKYAAIRGQATGPVSFGFKIVDEERKPIIYNEEVRSLLFEFIQHKVNVQCEEMRKKNENAFVWIDEPGLGWVFNSLAGYGDLQAKKDYQEFMAGIDGLKAIHLCANVNLPYLLELGLDMVSFDAYQLQFMPKAYSEAVAKFITLGGLISWGIVPTDSTTLNQETPENLAKRITDYWQVVADNADIEVDRIASQSLIAPARCCLKNIGLVGAEEEACNNKSASCSISSIEERIVEKAFLYLGQISEILKEQHR
jgi:hypothetical protein